MQGERLVSLRNPWFTGSIAITAAIAVVAAGFGFVWLPHMEVNTRFAGMWDAICSAAGVPQPSPAAGKIIESSFRTSGVVLTPGLLAPADAEAVGRGATLSLRCAMCHGARGLSEANTPNLAGQYATVVFKQLEDYKSGARASAVMSPLAAGLSTRDIRDLSAYYAYLPRPPAATPAGTRPVPQIVQSGAPMRGIAPCGSCHGDLDHQIASPWLGGEPAAYIGAQLQAFASGARHNDQGAQMRNIARRMTPAEIDAAASYYASQP